MCDQMVHRGPDDEGVYVSGNIGLGNRRLSVIDPSPAGHQPMTNEDNTVWITFNGEVYNFPELHRELRRRGHRFRSSTDTETVLHAYEEWGTCAFERFNGMFGLAIWDERANRLLLARDRIGKKPLYYYMDSTRLIFASELQALVRGADDLDLDIDRSAISQYLTFGYFPAPLTPYAKVRKLRPGELGILDGKRFGTVRYSAPPVPNARNLHEEEALDEFDRLLRDAVKRRLISDVPVGAFLSAGIDSTCMAATAAELVSGQLKTFSVGFPEPRYDESVYARQVAAHIGSDHHELMLGKGEISGDDVIEIMSRFDEPFYDHSAIPTSYVAGLARRDVTVALTGDGGDELFIGYEHLREQARFFASAESRSANGTTGRAPLPMLKALKRIVRRSPAQHARIAEEIDYRYAIGEDWAESYIRKWPRVAPETRLELLGDDASAESARLLRELDTWNVHADPIERLAALDLVNYMPNDILVKVDRITMRHSLEARVPLLDREIVNFAMGLPLSLKLDRRGGKALLRRYLQRRLDDTDLLDLVTRPKHGFRFPLAPYVDGSLRPAIEEGLRDRSFQEDLGLSGKSITAIIEDHYTRRTGGKSLWLIFCLYLWWATTRSQIAPSGPR